MKTVFSNSQVAHVWAQQTQSDGRNSSGSFYFTGSKIWSYGAHYLAAEIHTLKNGKRFALVNSHGYSSTTGQHRSDIYNAVRGLMPVFSASDPSDPRKAIKELDARCKDAVASALRRSKVTNKDGIKYELESIEGYYAEATELRKLLKLAAIKPKASDLKAVRTHLEKRLSRYKELNTPEMIARKKLEAEKRELKRAQLAELAARDAIAGFRAGANVNLRDLPYELLRIKGDVVQTSRGAEVPLDAARVLYKAVTSGRDVLGMTIGSFTVIHVVSAVNERGQPDKAVKIGCHEILLSEAARVLA